MLYLAIPAHNEVATIGVLLWRLRTVLAEFPREYEVVVYDDASTDETAEVAEQYAHAMPVTVLRGAKAVGYAGAVDALARFIAGHTRYPRRDAMLLMQADFTDPPGIVPEFARRFEGGADLVVGERTAVVDAPVAVRRLFTAAGWALRPFVRVEGVRDLTGSMRLVRISALRDLLRTAGDAPVCEGDSWTANADLLLRLVPHARRVESVPVEPTYGVRTRESRRITVRDALAALRWGWRARGRRAVPTSAPEVPADTGGRGARPAVPPVRRREEPEMTAERVRERTKDRNRSETDEPRGRRDRRPERERSERVERDRPDRSRGDQEKRDVRPPRADDAAAESRRPDRDRKKSRDGARAESPARDTAAGDSTGGESTRNATPSRVPGPGPETRARRNTPLPSLPDHIGILDDPFAGRRTTAVDPFSGEPAASTPSADALSRSAPSDTGREDARGTSDVVRGPDAVPTTESRAASEPIDETSGMPESDGDDLSNDDENDDEHELLASDDAASTSRERKRRRNRRSRRRRSKSRDTDAETVADEGRESGDTASAPSAEAGTPNARRGGSGDGERGAMTRDEAVAPDRDGHDTDPDDDSDNVDNVDNVDSDGEGGEGDDESRGARGERGKRRGRRGRRGGQRRSRGRTRDRAAGDTGGADGGNSDARGDGGGGNQDGSDSTRNDGPRE